MKLKPFSTLCDFRCARNDGLGEKKIKTRVKLNLYSILVAISLLFTKTTLATDLMDVYEQALQNDPTFKTAAGTYFANKEILPQARSNLLPNLTLTNAATHNNNSGDVNQTIAPGDQSYDQNIFQLSATQPVFNYASWMQFQQAKSSVKSAEAMYNAAAQDLILRVGQAYLNILQAKDTLSYTQAQKLELKNEMRLAQERYKVGLETMTAVYQAQAAYDTMVAQEMANKNQLFIQFENLRTLTNQSYSSIAPLKKDTVPLIRPTPSNAQVWVDKATQQNYTLLSAKYGMEAARTNIKTQQGGHYPTVNVNASYYNEQDNATVSTTPIGQNTTVGLNLSLPLYQGGLVTSQVRQAQYQYETAAAQFQSAYLNTVVNTKTAYNTLIVSINQIKADKQAVTSSKSSLASTQAQFKVGTATMVDVLTAQQQLFRSLNQNATDQYTYMNAILSLKLAAGTLNVADLQELNHWLDRNPKNAIYNDEKIE